MAKHELIDHGEDSDTCGKQTVRADLSLRNSHDSFSEKKKAVFSFLKHP